MSSQPKASRTPTAAAASHPGKRFHNDDGLLVLADVGVFAVIHVRDANFCSEEPIPLVLRELSQVLAPSQTSHPPNVENVMAVLRAVVRRTSIDVLPSGMRGIHVDFASLVVRGDTTYVSWCGLSRVYRYRKGELLRMTTDHSFWEDNVRKGSKATSYFSEAFERVLPTRTISRDDSGNGIDLLESVAEPGDLYLLCTHGFWKQISDDELLSRLESMSSEQQLSTFVQELVHELAVERLSDANVTCVCLAV